jgi:hypothetical protein
MDLGADADRITAACAGASSGGRVRCGGAAGVETPVRDEGSGCTTWLVVLIAAAAYAWWHFYGDSGPKAMEARVEVLEQRVEALEVRSNTFRDSLMECESNVETLELRADSLHDSLLECQDGVDQIVDGCRCAR